MLAMWFTLAKDKGDDVPCVLDPEEEARKEAEEAAKAKAEAEAEAVAEAEAAAAAADVCEGGEDTEGEEAQPPALEPVPAPEPTAPKVPPLGGTAAAAGPGGGASISDLERMVDDRVAQLKASIGLDDKKLAALLERVQKSGGLTPRTR